MPVLELELDINAAPSTVFGIISDIEGSPKHQPKIKRIEMLTDGPVGAGTAWNETREMMGKEATMRIEMTQFDPPNSYTADCTSMGTHYSTRFDVLPHRDGTKLKMAMTQTSKGLFASLMNKVFAGVMRKAIWDDLDSIKRAAEGRES